MTVYPYVIAKFVPDMARDEPVNVGIVMYSPDSKEAHGKFIDNFQPLGARYHHKVNLDSLKTKVEEFRGRQLDISEKYLLDLTNSFQYNLRFAGPSGIVAKNSVEAMDKVFQQLIGSEVKRRRKIGRAH